MNQIGGLMQEQRLAGRLQAMDIQDMGGSRKTVAAAIEFVRGVLAESNKVVREPLPASELKVAAAMRRVRRLFRASPPTPPWGSRATSWSAMAGP